VSWLDDLDDDEPEFDEADVRMRPNPKANRPRTKRRPAHSDAEIARVLGVDRGRYTVLVDEDLPTERTALAARARELRKTPIVTGDRSRRRRRVGRRRHTGAHRRHRGAHLAAQTQRR